MEENYWWIVSVLITDYVGGTGIDDESYPVKNKSIFKLFGPNNETTYKKISFEISSKTNSSRRVDFVWCLGDNNKEEHSFAQKLEDFLRR